MGRESFEDEETAKLLNERFISIKVDREERPDIDSIYMNVCQTMMGHGGWPLNVFLTSEQKPFYAGTYFPKESLYGRPSFKEVIVQLYNQYIQNRKEIDIIADDVKNALNQLAKRRENELPSTKVLNMTFHQLASGFNSSYGGFTDAPKFPMPHHLMFLMRYYKWSGNKAALNMVEKTLECMANGGIYDQVGFGFSRYSTDNSWLVPHFEKMLYDNALLLYAYAEAYQLTKKEKFRRIAEQIISFVEREMMNDDGAFYSAIDADSEGEEGKYYVWTKNEVIQLLGADDGEFFCKVFDISSDGNFEGRNILNLIHTNLVEVFREFKLGIEEGKAKLEICRLKLFEARGNRVYPHLDDKILTSWNALMIAGLAKAGQAFQNCDFINKAEKAIKFIEDKLTVDEKLMARYRDGEAKYHAYFDDWAFLQWANLELYEATFSFSYLERASTIAQKMMNLFWDEEEGAFFFTNKEGETLLVREKQIVDDAIPSGNSVAAVQMMKLGHITGETKWLDVSIAILQLYKRDIEAYGAGYTFLLQSLLMKEMPLKECVFLGEKAKPLLKNLQTEFTPNIVKVAAVDFKEESKIMDRGYKKLNDELTIYICENFTCQRPVTTEEEFLKLIEDYH